MGYYTDHNLTVYELIDGKLVEMDDPTEIIAKLRDTCENAKYSLNDDGIYKQETKWYDSREDMIKFSKLYPDKVFQLHGVGEESEDMWDEYYKDGKFQDCGAIIKFPSFDINKLIELKKENK